ncbi:MAG: ATP-binding protein [Candidatus Eremiobacteraeota bacterium]|nr:ATP-binding protein [Candidatus Eremiobacteraeota bacterium]
MPAAIALEGVTLVRRTQEELHYDLKRSALRLLSGRLSRVRRRTVLEDVSVRIEHGEKVGIIGPNGSGKSTLLKIIAGVLVPSRGRVSVDGSLSALIELGVGFDPELSLVDNIVYYGVLLGHSEELVRGRIEEILEFAELVDHRNEPTKILSSGMAARLSFAIATEFRPEVLLVDEVLSVGDERFRRKCQARIDRFWDEHSTIVLVSHDMLTVARTCNRVIWIEEGRVRFDGPAQRAADLYMSTIPSASSFRKGDELVELAEKNPRGEVLVRGTSGDLQLYLIRGGRRHWISSPAWCRQHGYEGADVVIVDDEVIKQVATGDVLS